MELNREELHISINWWLCYRLQRSLVSFSRQVLNHSLHSITKEWKEYDEETFSDSGKVKYGQQAILCNQGEKVKAGFCRLTKGFKTISVWL